MLTLARGARTGATLVELVVATVVGGVVLGLVATISMRQQRLYADIADGAALAGQLRDAAAVLPIDLRAASAAAGDIRSGEARDTSLEVRATIASAVVCDTTRSGLVLAPAAPGAKAFASISSAIEVGDTAWVLAGESPDSWMPFRVAGSGSAPAGQCGLLGPRLDAMASGRTRVVVSLDGLPSAGDAIGRPMRVTRPVRYSLYRAADGGWYLGQRDWNPGNARFNTIQPVSGPFLSPGAGGLAFRYLDAGGALLPAPVADTRAIALVRAELRGQTKHAARALGAAGPAAKRGDSITISVLLHNRR